MEEKLKMIWFCDKYGLALHKLHRHLGRFQTVEVQGYKKPWIIDNEHNKLEAQKLIFSRQTKPKKNRLPLKEFCQKYNIDPARLKNRWKCILKEEMDGEIFIAETRNNLRHIGII
jgi:hypothetical protein